MQEKENHINTSTRTTDYQSHTVEILVTAATVLVGMVSIYLTFFDGKHFF